MEIRKKLIEVALRLDAINGRHARPTCLNVRRVRRVTCKLSVHDVDQHATVVARAPLLDIVQGAHRDAVVEAA